MTIVACPVHGQRLLAANDGSLLGRCEGCMEEVAQALDLISSGVAAANAWASSVLARHGKKTTGPRRSISAESAPRARGG